MTGSIKTQMQMNTVVIIIIIVVIIALFILFFGGVRSGGDNLLETIRQAITNNSLS